MNVRVVVEQRGDVFRVKFRGSWQWAWHQLKSYDYMGSSFTAQFSTAEEAETSGRDHAAGMLRQRRFQVSNWAPVKSFYVDEGGDA